MNQPAVESLIYQKYNRRRKRGSFSNLNLCIHSLATQYIWQYNSEDGPIWCHGNNIYKDFDHQGVQQSLKSRCPTKNKMVSATYWILSLFLPGSNITWSYPHMGRTGAERIDLFQPNRNNWIKWLHVIRRYNFPIQQIIKGLEFKGFLIWLKMCSDRISLFWLRYLHEAF